MCLLLYTALLTMLDPDDEKRDYDWKDVQRILYASCHKFIPTIDDFQEGLESGERQIPPETMAKLQKVREHPDYDPHKAKKVFSLGPEIMDYIDNCMSVQNSRSGPED